MLGSDAPTGPGVYYLVARGRLVYVGKASNLRRRLAQHQRSRRWSRVTAVRWELVASSQSALAREAAVLAALEPRWNRAHIDVYFNFVQVTRRGLQLATDGDYGCFPHLGRGAMSDPGRACIDGFDALARIVHATKPAADLVDDFLSGGSDRLLDEPIIEEQPHIRLGIERDRHAARGFFAAGPRAMRRLRVRHGGDGPVSREQFVEWIAAEVDELLRDAR